MILSDKDRQFYVKLHTLMQLHPSIKNKHFKYDQTLGSWVKPDLAYSNENSILRTLFFKTTPYKKLFYGYYISEKAIERAIKRSKKATTEQECLDAISSIVPTHRNPEEFLYITWGLRGLYSPRPLIGLLSPKHWGEPSNDTLELIRSVERDYAEINARVSKDSPMFSVMLNIFEYVELLMLMFSKATPVQKRDFEPLITGGYAKMGAPIFDASQLYKKLLDLFSSSDEKLSSEYYSKRLQFLIKVVGEHREELTSGGFCVANVDRLYNDLLAVVNHAQLGR